MRGTGGRRRDAAALRAAFRAEFGLTAEDFLLLQVGSGFKTKGLTAVCWRWRTAAGAAGTHALDRHRPGCAGDCRQAAALPGRAGTFCDAAIFRAFLLGADLLIHPAYNENTGTVLLEALVAGLPVLCTGVCGYAPYVTAAAGGLVLPEPFAQEALDAALLRITAQPEQRRAWQQNALAWAEVADIYSNAERAAEIMRRRVTMAESAPGDSGRGHGGK